MTNFLRAFAQAPLSTSTNVAIRSQLSLSCHSLAALMVVVCLGALVGCGGDEEPSTAEAPPVQPTNVDPVIEQNQDPPLDATPEQQDPPEGEGDPEGEAGKDPEPEDEPEPEPELPKRPDEVSKWKPEDYETAKRDKDRRLAEAVAFLSERYVGNEKVAETLVKLLVNEVNPDQQEPEEGQPQRPAEPLQVSRTLALQIVDALGKSKTATGEKALRELLLGKLETPLVVNQVIPMVLKAAAENSAEYEPYENLVFSVLVSANTLVEKSRLPNLKPLQLQSTAISSINATSNEKLRIRLARHLEDPQVPQETAQVIESLLAKDTPENDSSQIILYRNLRTEKRTRSQIETTLAQNNTRALELLLGIPEKLELPPPPGTLSRPSVHDGKPVDDHRDRYFTFAKNFWTDDLLDHFYAQVRKDGPAGAPIPLSFLGSVPRPRARFMVSELLSFYGYQGSRSWGSANMMGKRTTDPGFIVLAKGVYQSSSLRRGTIVKQDEDRPRVEKEKKDEWQMATQQMVATWFQRCYSAARQANPPMKSETAEDEMKIHIHPNANIVAQYHVNWPEDAQSKIQGIEIAPLKLHYFRIEEEGFVDKMVSRYQRYAGKGSRGETHKLRGSHWLDGLVNGLEPHAKRSIDIQISGKEESESDKTPAGEAKPSPMVIEILTVEIPAPEAPAEEKVTLKSE